VARAFTLAGDKGTLIWKAGGTVLQGCALALCGKTSEALRMVTAGIADWQATRATARMPLYLCNLAGAYLAISQLDDAWRCVDEATTAVEATGERWCEAEVNRNCR
jgi:predicted ATPase